MKKSNLSKDGNDGSRFRHSTNSSFKRSRCYLIINQALILIKTKIKLKDFTFVPPNNRPSSLDNVVCNR